jgi:hypothetical protein
MRYLMLGLVLVGCDQDRMTRRGFTGDWTLRLTCDAEVDAVPGCAGEMASLVQIWRPDDPDASLADGEHRTLLPGYVDPDGSYAGVAGPVVAGWSEGEVSLELAAFADDPLASPDDASAWADHRLLVVGQVGERCWSARWAWTDGDGVEVAVGDARASRRNRDCE